MALTVLQRRTGTAATTSVTAASWTTPAVNNILAAVVWSDGATPTITGWTAVTGTTNGPAAHTSVIYAKLALGTETSAIATDGAAANMEIFAVELDGVVNTSLAAAIDQGTGFGSGTASTTALSTSATLAQAIEYALVGNGWSGAISAPSYNAGFTTRKSATRQAAGDLITAATTAIGVTCTWTTSRTRAMSLATFKASITAPTVTTSAASSVATTSATLNGNVTATGDSVVTERGFVYSTSSNPPTTADTKQTVAGTTGSYTFNATGLSAGTLYHYRAYAINDAGTSYGGASSTDFTTSSGTTSSSTLQMMGV